MKTETKADIEHRRTINLLISEFEDRDRIELLAPHGGGLVPASLRRDAWNIQGALHHGVALCLDVEVPALRGAGDPVPVAYALKFSDDDNIHSSFDPTPIVSWCDTEYAYVNLDAFKERKRFPIKLAVDLLHAEEEVAVAATGAAERAVDAPFVLGFGQRSQRFVALLYHG